MAYLISGCLAAIGAVIILALTSPSASEDASPRGTIIGVWEWLDVVCCTTFTPRSHLTLADASEKSIQDILGWTY